MQCLRHYTNTDSLQHIYVVGHIPAVLTPNLALRMGPIVEPQGLSLRTTKSCRGTSAKMAASLTKAAVMAVVA